MSAKESRIENLLFDLGGVLIDWNPRYLYTKMFEDEAEMEYFLKEVATMDWNEQQDAGRPFEEAIDILVEKFPDYRRYIQAYFYRWPEMLKGQIRGTVETLRTLKNLKQQRLFALTNWSAQTFPHALERFEFLNWFEGILVSGEENLKKPDPRIYELTAERFALIPERTLFIDDSQRNVDAAKQLGFYAVRFESPKGLWSDLEKFGVL